MRYGIHRPRQSGSGIWRQASAASGFDVTVHDLNRQAADRHLALGASWAASPAEAAADADAVITCLPSPAASAAVVTATAACCSALKRGGTWIEMSTTDQHEIARIAALAAAKGIDMLEAPVTGGVHRAAAGEITVLVGGDKKRLRRPSPGPGGHGRRDLPYGPAGQCRRHQGHHQHAGLHPSGGGRRGADAGQAWRARSRPGLRRHQGQLRQQLRP